MIFISNSKEVNRFYEYFCFIANNEHAYLRIDKFLVDKKISSSRNSIQNAIKLGFVTVNNCTIKQNYKLKAKDIILVKKIFFCKKSEILPENIPLTKVYDDEDILVIDKSAGLVVHPGCGNLTGTLLNAIAWNYLKLFNMGINYRFSLVHRIDKDTSGLLVIAKTLNAKNHLKKQFLKKTVKRVYWALVWGDLKENEGIIEGNIGRDINNRLRMSVFQNGEMGKPATTRYKVIERFGYVTLLECKLDTGRTHQIRVHMKYIGHIIFNDVRYGGNKILKGSCYIKKYKNFIHNCFELCPRQALHAKTLSFTHPKTGKYMHFETSLPNDMLCLIDKWKHFSVQ